MRNLSFFVCLLLLCQTGFAATSFKDLLNEYQYNVTVEWDQQDAEALKKYEKEFQAGLQNLITEGHSSESLLLEAVSALPSETLKKDISHALFLHQQEQMSSHELFDLLKEKADSLGEKGASWLPVKNILIGTALTYAALVAIGYTVAHWDTVKTDCNKQNCSPPPNPPFK